MTWNYRIIKHDTAESVYFAVHEVYYDKQGNITNWTQNPIDITGDSAKEIARTLQMILTDTKQPVLKESELEKKIGRENIGSKSGKNYNHERA